MTEIAAQLGIDWWRMVADLERLGYSHQAIGELIDVPRTTIAGWKNLAAEPRHRDGERLVSLWCWAIPAAREALPRK